MSETRCPECQCLLKEKDLKNDKCWKCGLSPVREIIEKTQNIELATKSELKEKKKQERFDFRVGKEQERLDEKEKNKQELENKTLSEKYGILDFYKFILWVMGGVGILVGVFGVIKYWKIIQRLPDETKLIYTIVWIFGLFGIYCGIKIIDFLFDLDKVKSNKV